MKTVWKMLPCPLYDVERLQSWLEDLAAEGLALQRFRLGTVFAVFTPQAPATVRYRLSATRRIPSLLDTTSGAPDEEEWQLSAAAGWHYVAGLAEFFVYRCDDARAPELNTDPQVQALSYKYARSNARWRLFNALFYAVFYPALTFHNRFFLMLAEEPALFISWLLFMLTFLLDASANLLRLESLTRRLKRGLAMRPHKNWRRARLHHRAGQLFTVAALVFFIVSLFTANRPSRDAGDWLPLQDYTAPLPFATLGDLAEGELHYDPEDHYTHSRVSIYHTPLVPVRYDLEQHATVRRGGQTVLDGDLYVDYYETAFPWLAGRLAGELPRLASWRYKSAPDRNFLHGGITVEVYGAQETIPYVLLRQDCRVMGASFFALDCGMEVETILPVLIERFAAGAPR